MAVLCKVAALPLIPFPHLFFIPLVLATLKLALSRSTGAVMLQQYPLILRDGNQWTNILIAFLLGS